MVNFATTPVDKPVTKGIYHISRHPMYLGGFLIFIGVGVAGASWIPLLLAMILIIVLSILAIFEERFCLHKFGNTYQGYMDRTPKKSNPFSKVEETIPKMTIFVTPSLKTAQNGVKVEAIS